MKIKCANCNKEYDISPWDDWICYCGCSQFIVIDFGHYWQLKTEKYLNTSALTSYMARYKKPKCGTKCMAKGCPVGNLVVSMQGTSKKLLSPYK